mgnify:CR=1 FL=1
MSEIISKDDVDQLRFVLNYAQNSQYIDCVQQLQGELSELEQSDFPVTHHFAPNVYARQMDAKAGTLVISKMHATEHLNFLMKGALTIMTEDGIQFLQAPAIIKSKAGTKRVGYFHEDTTWVTVHPTEETDLDAIENLVIVPQDSEIDFLKQIKGELPCLG